MGVNPPVEAGYDTSIFGVMLTIRLDQVCILAEADYAIRISSLVAMTRWNQGVAACSFQKLCAQLVTVDLC